MKSTTPYLDLKETLSDNRLLGLWRLTKGFRLKYAAATISLGIAAISKTSTYLLLRYFVDHIFAEQGQRFPVSVIAAGFVLLALVEGSFSFLSGRFAAMTSEGITQRLRDYLFDHIQHLTFSYHNHIDTGELVQRVTSDIDGIRRFFAEQAIGIGRVFLLFVINFFFITQISWTLALISIVMVPIIIWISAFFFKRIIKTYEAYQEQEAVITTTLQENLSGVRVVKAFARQIYEIDKFQRGNWERYIRGKKLTTIHSLFWPVSDVICGLQLLVGYLAGALMVMNGTISIGDYVAFAGVIIWIIFPMRNLGRLIVQTSTGLVSYQRTTKIIREDREPLDVGISEQLGDLKGEIEFKHISFWYEKDFPVLEDISFSCKPGQVIALLGSTGSGKSTLVNLLPRFFDYSMGSITLDGIELNQYSRKYLRRNIGIVEQEPFLFSRTIRGNITYGVEGEIPREKIEEAAKAAAIHDSIMKFQNGYDTLVGERGVTLSGGQKQRVAIARTLLKNPRILILDDSTSSVDTETEAEIRQAMNKLMENRTTFIIAHRIQSIMQADLILVMDKGRIVQMGKHDELVSKPGIYQEIYTIQTRIEEELEEEIANAG